jgi:colicin import membrane protein
MRPLKVFQTHIGFYDLVVSAASKKAAAAAWNVSPRLFQHGLAEQAAEPAAIKAALHHPGVVLRRLHGQKGSFTAEPNPPRVPPQSAREKERATEARRRRDLHEAKQKREQVEAERQARQAAKRELAKIASQEAMLRKRRQVLKKQLHQVVS